jgi:hypothetical protein
VAWAVALAAAGVVSLRAATARARIVRRAQSLSSTMISR